MNNIDSSGTYFRDDGFAVTAAEPWIREKVNIIQHYLTAAVAGLAAQADDVVFVDLFAGNGLYSLGSKDDIFPGSALMALSLDLPISKFVLCEGSAQQFGVLKIRINRDFRRKNVVLLEGRLENLVDRLSMYIPQSQEGHKVAVLCVCDPFSLDISIAALEKLGDRGFTFMIPFTFVLNDRVNFRHYLGEGREQVKGFLGSSQDVAELEMDLENNVQFYKRLIRAFGNKMEASGFNGAISAHKLDSGLMEMPMYYFGVFSKLISAKAIREDVEATRNVQFDLF